MSELHQQPTTPTPAPTPSANPTPEPTANAHPGSLPGLNTGTTSREALQTRIENEGGITNLAETGPANVSNSMHPDLSIMDRAANSLFFRSQEELVNYLNNKGFKVSQDNEGNISVWKDGDKSKYPFDPATGAISTDIVGDVLDNSRGLFETGVEGYAVVQSAGTYLLVRAAASGAIAGAEDAALQSLGVALGYRDALNVGAIEETAAWATAMPMGMDRIRRVVSAVGGDRIIKAGVEQTMNALPSEGIIGRTSHSALEEIAATGKDTTTAAVIDAGTQLVTTGTVDLTQLQHNAVNAGAMGKVSRSMPHSTTAHNRPSRAHALRQADLLEAVEHYKSGQMTKLDEQSNLFVQLNQPEFSQHRASLTEDQLQSLERNTKSHIDAVLSDPLKLRTRNAIEQLATSNPELNTTAFRAQILDISSNDTSPGRANSREFITNLTSLSKAGTQGIDRAVANANQGLNDAKRQFGANDSAAITRTMEGYFAEAKTAINLKNSGFQITNISVDATDGTVLAHPSRNLITEIDLIAQRDGETYFVEVKRSVGAFVDKNRDIASGAVSEAGATQLGKQQNLARANGAELVIAINNPSDFTKHRDEVTRALTALENDSGVRPLIVSPPSYQDFYEVNGRDTFAEARQALAQSRTPDRRAAEAVQTARNLTTAGSRTRN